MADASRATAFAIGGACLAVGASLVFRLGGPDLFGHLAVGRWIVEHGVIPSSDPFSYTAEGPWRYMEGLAEVILHGVDALGGVPLLIAFFALLGVAIGGLVALRTEGRPTARASVILLVGAASHAAMAPKPQVFSYLCFAGLLTLLDRARTRPRWLIAIPPLCLAWANLHRGGIFGLVAVALFGAAWAWDRAPGRGRRVGLLAIAFGGALLACLANPGGTFYLTSAFDVATRAAFAEHIAEWQPLDIAGLWERHAAAIPLAVFALAGRLERREGALRPRPIDGELLVLLAATLLASRAGRLMPFFAIAAAPAASRGLDTLLGALATRTEGKVRPSVWGAAALALGIATLGARYVWGLPPSTWGVGVVEYRVPVRAGRFLRAHPPPGRMFNSLDFGGPFMNAIGPAQRVFVDGRNDTVYDASFVRRALVAGRSPDDFARATEGHDIGWAAVRWSGPSDRSYRFLHADPSWTLVHWTDACAVLVHVRDEASREYVAAHGYRELSLHDAFPRVSRGGDTPADEQLALEVERALATAPDDVGPLYLAAMLRARRGDEEGYRAARERFMAVAASRRLETPAP